MLCHADVNRMYEKGILMKFQFAGIASALALTACGVVSEGGAGQTTTGEPVSGLVSWDQATGERELTISSPSGWSCASSLGPNPNPGIKQRTERLNCNNGATGTIILTFNQTQQQMVGNFQLSNGKAGQVVFGRT